MYYKATLAGGKSYFDPKFVYHMGLNVHPKPDKKSNASCGEGIHLGKSLWDCKRAVPNATEYYEAEAGVILGEDEHKVRVTHCFLIRKLEASETTNIVRPPPTPKQTDLDKLIMTSNHPLFGDWLALHGRDITQKDVDNQRIEIEAPGQHLTLTARNKLKDIREAIKTIGAHR